MPDTPLNILLVEDEQDHADLIRVHLRRGREDSVTVEWADRVSKGEEMLDAKGFDAVVLDMMLPDSSGVETVRRVHAHSPRVPLLVLTSADDDAYGLEAVQHGAEDYISKTHINGQSLMRAIRYAIERCGRRHAESALESARAEMGIAQKIQRSLYPLHAPPVPAFDIAGGSLPAASVGGDYFDYIPMGENQLGIAIGDVSGHGIGPALLMAETRATLRTLARTQGSVGESLTTANLILLDGMAEGRFITLILTCLDTKNRTLTYVNAGHPDGLIFGPDGQAVTRLSSSGCPLGVLADERYESSAPLPLSTGQIVLLFTDGIPEAFPPGEFQQFGIPRIESLIHQNRHLPAQLILEELLSAVRKHTHPGEPDDDVTAVVMKVL